jgi:hypothetical protein
VVIDINELWVGPAEFCGFSFGVDELETEF